MPTNKEKNKVLLKSKKIISYIEMMNLSLSEFAKKCKITQSSFSIHLNNKRELSPPARRKVMKEFRKVYPEMKWTDIFDFEEDTLENGLKAE